MNPKERTNPSPLGTRRHPLRNLKIRKPRPHTRLINAKHRKILRLYIRHITLIRNRQRTSFQITKPRRMILNHRRTGTDIVRITRVAYVPPIGAGKERRGAFRACYFGGGGLACWEGEDVPWVWGVVEVVVEPPLGEGHVFDGRDGAVVVGVSLGGYVESEHAWVDEGFFFEKIRKASLFFSFEMGLPACPDTCGDT